MPRRYDFSRKATAEEYRNTGSFAPLLTGRAMSGPGEVTEEQLLFGGPDAQFSYSSKGDPSAPHYDNGRLDPVYDWLCRNMRGSWLWYEMESNHGHSVSIDVWIDRTRDAERFFARWEDRFEIKEWAVANNAKLRGIADETPGFERTPAINLYSVALEVLDEDTVMGGGSLFVLAVLAVDTDQAEQVARIVTEESHLWDDRLHNKSIRFLSTEDIDEDALPDNAEIHSWMLVAEQDAAAQVTTGASVAADAVPRITIHDDVMLAEVGGAQLVLHPGDKSFGVDLTVDGSVLVHEEATWTADGFVVRFSSGSRQVAAMTITWAEIDTIRARLGNRSDT